MKNQNNSYVDIRDIDLDAWSKKLGCTIDQLKYCIERVRTSWVSVEAFWSINSLTIQKSFPVIDDNIPSN